ncbi:MAG: HAMP domain-containing protein [Candidatus Margulisbacteria bacterium]|nr:HAMP domain-containing protein [Candidatus Margulisiibacteriota bacterium]
MRRSLIAKILGGYIILICFLISIVLFFSFHTIRAFYIDSAASNLEKLNEALIFKIKPYLKRKAYQELDYFVKDFGKIINRRITVILPNGLVIADSEKNPKNMENHALRSEIIQALQIEKGSALRYSTTVESEMLYGAQAIKDNDEILAILRLSVYLKEIKQFLQKVNLNIFRSSLILLLLSLVVIMFSSRLLTIPINKLRNATSEIAAGNFKSRIFLNGNNEFKDLAENFNEMSEKLNSLFNELTNQKEELNTVISSIQEALLVIEDSGKISLSNQSFQKITAGKDIQGKYYWEVLREPVFIELMKYIQKEKKNLQKEIMLKDKTYLLSGTVLPACNKFIILLFDVTEIRKLEKIKKDFVTNVSHELRTPLTAIKGFVETLEDETGDKHKKYIDIIKKHTDRLIYIVQDLLLLSQLEEKETILHAEKINLNKLLENVLKIFEQKAKNKNLTINYQNKNPDLTIHADNFMLEQVFINLIDNAIKYTEKGEINLEVTSKDKQANIKINDTGLGIPKEDLPRIFERFYVVDKSRSRKMGGTGLGLSIVKHIVLMHEGTINVESNLGQGSTFIITLPLK